VTGMDRKLASLRYTTRGIIPDGLLFRVSSIDPESGAAFGRQEQFVRDLLAALPPDHRRRLAGIGPESP